MNPSKAALATAEKIRRLNIRDVDAMAALFDTGKEDKEKCDKIIVELIATIIDEGNKNAHQWIKSAIEALQLAAKDHSGGCECKICQCLQNYPE